MKKRPVQVYLDPEERSLLESVAERLGLSMAETLRLALRRLAADESGAEDPLMKLMGSLDNPNVPVDLSIRHDEYFVTGYPPARAAEEAQEADGID